MSYINEIWVFPGVMFYISLTGVPDGFCNNLFAAIFCRRRNEDEK